MPITKPHLSSKHINIQKDNTVIFAAIGLAVFIVVFGLIAGRALLSQVSYNQRVIGEKKTALQLAQDNTKNAEDLEQSFISFAGESINIISGDPKGDGPLGGTNPKIILDALPSVYDYPALSSSIEKILLDNGYQIERIGGSEDEALSAANTGNGNPNSIASAVATDTTLIEIPYPIDITSSVEGTQRLLNVFERSIRPFYVESISLTGSDQSLNAKINMKTFYQPGIQFQAGSKVVN